MGIIYPSISTADFASKSKDNSFSGSQTITGSLIVSGSTLLLSSSTRSQIAVIDERLDLIATGSRIGGTQILIEATNNAGAAQVIVSATNDAVLQAGSSSANNPYYFHADADSKFVAVEADDASGAIYVGGSGYPSSVNIGSAGSRIISIGNTSGSTALIIRAGTAGTVISGALNVSGSITASVGGIKFADGSTLTSSVGLGGGGGGVSETEVSGAITGALTPYATLSGVSGSFAILTASNNFTATNTFTTVSASVISASQYIGITGGGGSGTVNTGNAGYIAYYPSTGTTVDDASTIYTSGSAVGIGTTSIAASALLELSSSNQGLLFPRVTGTNRASMTGTAGLIVYQTDTSGSDGEGLYIYKSTGWVQII